MIGKCFESLKSSFFNILSYIVLELVCPDLEFNYKFVAKIQKNKQTTINSLFLCCFDKTLGKNIRIHDFSPSVFLIAINFIIFAPPFGKNPSGRHIDKDAEQAFICGYRNLANSMLCRDNAMLFVHNFGIYCTNYHTKSVG